LENEAVRVKRLDQGWVVTIAASVALTVGATAITAIPTGVFMGPVISEFHWSRGQYFLVTAIASIMGAFSIPYLGHLADRIGVRRVMLPGIVIYGCSVMCLAALNESFAFYMTVGLVVGASAMIQSVPLYSKVVSAWMDKKRGLALAVTMVGNGLGSVASAPLAAYIIRYYGWRDARLAFGAAVLVVALPTVFFFIKEPPRERLAKRFAFTGEGLETRVAIASMTFWIVCASTFFAGGATAGTMTQIFPLLTDHGFNGGVAAAALSVLAAAQICGRFLFGSLLDRFPTPKIGILLLISCALGLVGLFWGTSMSGVLGGAMLLGFGAGAELEVGAFFTSRYFGMKNFAQLYGYVFGSYIIGYSLAQYLMAASHDRTGSYFFAISAAIGALALAAVLIATLGGYVFMPPPDDVLAAEEELEAA
jgi:MFS family permease